MTNDEAEKPALNASTAYLCNRDHITLDDSFSISATQSSWLKTSRQVINSTQTRVKQKQACAITLDSAIYSYWFPVECSHLNYY